MDQKEINRLTAKVLHYLSFRARSRQEIVNYLIGQQINNDLQIEVLKKIESMNLIDDQDFSAQLINAKLKKGWGPKKIHFDLLNKGIDKSASKSATNQIRDQEWIQAASKYLQKKSSSWINLSGIARRQKMYNLLYAKGYTTKIIQAAIDDQSLPE